MAEPGTASSSRAVSLTVGVSADRRYLGLLGDVTERLARHAGLRSTAARRLGDAVDRAVDGVLPHAAAHAGRPTIEVEYATTPDELSACVRCDVAAGADGRDRGTSAPDPIEASLAEGGRLATLRGLVDHVQVGREGPSVFCRLTCQLPSPTR